MKSENNQLSWIKVKAFVNRCHCSRLNDEIISLHEKKERKNSNVLTSFFRFLSACFLFLLLFFQLFLFVCFFGLFFFTFNAFLFIIFFLTFLFLLLSSQIIISWICFDCSLTLSILICSMYSCFTFIFFFVIGMFVRFSLVMYSYLSSFLLSTTVFVPFFSYS